MDAAAAVDDEVDYPAAGDEGEEGLDGEGVVEEDGEGGDKKEDLAEGEAKTKKEDGKKDDEEKLVLEEEEGGHTEL